MGDCGGDYSMLWSHGRKLRDGLFRGGVSHPQRLAKQHVLFSDSGADHVAGQSDFSEEQGCVDDVPGSI